MSSAFKFFGVQLVVLVLTASVARAGGNTGLLYALFFDGSYVSAPPGGKDVWWSYQAAVGGRHLFGGRFPVRMLEDRTLAPTPKGPQIFMSNGDVLPGKLAGFLPAATENDLPDRLVVAVGYPLLAADPHGMAIRADRIARITQVASSAVERPAGEPGSLLLTDGARLTVRAMHWSSEGLTTLTERGLTTVRFDAIADFCLPHPNMMEAVLDDALYPPLGQASVVARLETVDGAVVTFHRGMMLAGSGQVPESPGWTSPKSAYVVIQPNWSSTPLLVAADAIRQESFRGANEVPLSLLPATSVGDTIGLHHWPWRRNESVEGKRLASGDIAVDLGVGMHSGCEIAFDLPQRAKSFTSLVGIDRRMPPQACAVAKVYVDGGEDKGVRTLFKSRPDQSTRTIFPMEKSSDPFGHANGFLGGGQKPTPIGPLHLEGCRRLVLVSQWAGDDASPETYPLDIGGHVDWLMPFVTVDTDQAEYCRSLRQFVPGWTKWDVDPAEAARVRVTPCWDSSVGHWLPVLYVEGRQPLILRHKLSAVTSANDILQLVVGHLPGGLLPGIELHADGIAIVPDRTECPSGILAAPSAQVQKPLARGKQKEAGGGKSVAEPRCLLRIMKWDLRRLQGRAVQLTLSLTFDQRQTGLAWCGLGTEARTQRPEVRDQKSGDKGR